MTLNAGLSMQYLYYYNNRSPCVSCNVLIFTMFCHVFAGDQIRTYMRSQRTMYTKFRRSGPSGGAREPRTEKEFWMEANLSFLKDYLLPRKKGRTSGGVSIVYNLIWAYYYLYCNYFVRGGFICTTTSSLKLWKLENKYFNEWMYLQRLHFCTKTWCYHLHFMLNAGI